MSASAWRCGTHLPLLPPPSATAWDSWASSVSSLLRPSRLLFPGDLRRAFSLQPSVASVVLWPKPLGVSSPAPQARTAPHPVPRARAPRPSPTPKLQAPSDWVALAAGPRAALRLTTPHPPPGAWATPSRGRRMHRVIKLRGSPPPRPSVLRGRGPFFLALLSVPLSGP